MSLYSVVVLIYLLLELGTGLPQSAPITTTDGFSLFTTSLNAQCDGCYVIALFTSTTTYYNTSVQATSFVPPDNTAFTFDPTGIVGGTTIAPTTYYPTASFLLYTAFKVVSSIYISNSCNIFSGAPSPVPGGDFLVPIPGGSNISQFLTVAESSFISHVGFPTCLNGGEFPASITDLTTTTGSTLLALSTLPVSITTSSSTEQSSSPPTSSNSTSTSSHMALRIALSTTIPIVFIIIILTASIYLQRYRNRKLAARRHLNEGEHPTTQAFLQQKAELDAEGKKKYEVEANETTYELPANSRNELPTQGIKRQELKGEEHSRELEGNETDKIDRITPLVAECSEGSSGSKLAPNKRPSLSELMDEVFSMAS